MPRTGSISDPSQAQYLLQALGRPDETQQRATTLGPDTTRAAPSIVARD